MTPTQDLSFWRGRIQQAKDNDRPIDDAMAVSFDWSIIDPVHHDVIFAHTKPDDRVLDVGCAYGRIAHWFKDDKYVGIDFVPEFIDEAKKRHPNKTFLVANVVEPLPFKDKEFDVAILVSVKGVIGPVVGSEVWAKAEAEFKRVAKKVIILAYGMSRPADIMADLEILCDSK